jgi:hypothetical protein
MHDLAFADAVRPARYRILGLLMRQYSIGHELILFKQRNPLLGSLEEFKTLSSSDKKEAVIEALVICYQRRLPFFWMVKNRLSDFDAAAEQFINYRRDGSLFPPSPESEADFMCNGDKESGRNLGAPMLARLYNFTITLPDREIKLHGETAFDFPLGLAQFLYFSKLEEDGSLRIENFKEFSVMADARKIREDCKKEQESKCQP